MLNTLPKWILCIKNMKQMVVNLYVQPETAGILSVLRPYLLAAIFYYAATSYQGSLPTYSRWFFQITCLIVMPDFIKVSQIAQFLCYVIRCSMRLGFCRAGNADGWY